MNARLIPALVGAALLVAGCRAESGQIRSSSAEAQYLEDWCTVYAGVLYVSLRLAWDPNASARDDIATLYKGQLERDPPGGSPMGLEEWHERAQTAFAAWRTEFEADATNEVVNDLGEAFMLALADQFPSGHTVPMQAAADDLLTCDGVPMGGLVIGGVTLGGPGGAAHRETAIAEIGEQR